MEGDGQGSGYEPSTRNIPGLERGHGNSNPLKDSKEEKEMSEEECTLSQKFRELLALLCQKNGTSTSPLKFTGTCCNVNG